MSEEIHETVAENTINPLIPNGIENLVLRCVICTEPVPARRARGRSKDTCSKECHAVLRKYRKYCILTSVCPACYHPGSPEERADFIRWRKDRKKIRRRAGRPRKGPDFVTAAREALEFIDRFNRESNCDINDFFYAVVREENGKQITFRDLIETALKAPIDTQGSV